MRTKYDTNSGLSIEDKKKIDETIKILNNLKCNEKDIIITVLLLGVMFETRADNKRIEEKLDEILEKHFK